MWTLWAGRRYGYAETRDFGRRKKFHFSETLSGVVAFPKERKIFFVSVLLFLRAIASCSGKLCLLLYFFAHLASPDGVDRWAGVPGTRRERERGGPPPPTDKCPLWLNCHTVLARCFALQQRRKRRLHYVIAFFPRRIDFFSSPLFRVCVYICGNNALAFKVVVMKSIFI